uniref:Uncharacterized protein n=1 Tax=Magallana gigas TaxID=29159 RepID=K1P1N2_MAGGI
MYRPCTALTLCAFCLDSTNTTVLATGGFRGDISTLQKLLRAKLVEYEHKHGEAMKVQLCTRERRH